MQYKIISIASGALLLMILAVFSTINLYMLSNTNDQIDGYLKDILHHNGNIQEHRDRPGDNKAGPEFVGSSFVINDTGEIIETIYLASILTEEVLSDLASKIKINEKLSGRYDTHRYMIKSYEGNYLVAVVEDTIQNDMLEDLLKVSGLVGTICFFFLLGLIVVLSRFITRPVEVAFNKQKRFIADSSHELKTPLSVISANIDLLKLEIGDNQRLDAMGQGIRRMNGLIHEMLILARTEHDRTSYRTFDLSHLMESTILPLEVVAFEQGKVIKSAILPDIHMTGSEEDIRKMISALMDNAIKYSRTNTEIHTALYHKGDSKVIEVFNEGIGVSKDQKDKLFDKFYRVDDSRQRETGGYGIGLSIVRNVVDKHKGKITIDSEPDEYIVFRITLP